MQLLSFRNSLGSISAALSLSFGEEEGLLSQAAWNLAYNSFVITRNNYNNDIITIMIIIGF